MKEEKYHSFDIEKYLNYAKQGYGIDAITEIEKILDTYSRPCNTDPIEEELDNRILLA
jgi:hypothetical protein